MRVNCHFRIYGYGGLYRRVQEFTMYLNDNPFRRTLLAKWVPWLFDNVFQYELCTSVFGEADDKCNFYSMICIP